MRSITAAAALAAMLFAQSVSAAPIVIRFSHVVAEQTPKGLMAIKFKELAEKRLAGKVVVEVYPDAKLAKDEEVIEALQAGKVQIAAPSLSKLGKYTRKYDIFDLPFLFRDLAAVDRFENSPTGQALLMEMADQGIIGLGYLHNGMKQLSANRPLRLPADAKGLKFRIQASDVLVAQFEAVGAVGVKKPLSEVYGLLQTRAVDGTENPWSNTYSQRFYEVQSYITESDHGVLDYLVVTSSSFWNGLPDDIRAPLKKALDESIAYGNQIAQEQAMSDRKKVIAAGRCQVIPLTMAERAEWAMAMVPVWNQFEPTIGADLVQAAKEANRATRSKRAKRKGD
jgi:C4-dicarboxylate-binding protein DctP